METAEAPPKHPGSGAVALSKVAGLLLLPPELLPEPSSNPRPHLSEGDPRSSTWRRRRRRRPLPTKPSKLLRARGPLLDGDGAKFVRSSSAAAAAAAASAAAHTHAAAVYSFACPLSDMPSAPSFPFAPFAPHAHPRRYPHHHRHCIIPPALRCAAFVCPSVAAQQKRNPRLLDSAASTCISGDRRLCPRSAVVHFAFEPSMTTSRACPVPRA